MAVNTRLIKRRIKSVGNTKKITKAMELTAASKMRKAVLQNANSRPYSKLGREMVLALQGAMEERSHPLLQENKDSKLSLLILISSDRGLAGGYNAQVLRRAFDFIKKQTSDHNGFEYITIGKKGADALRRFKGKIIASFTNMGNNPSITDIRPITELAMKEYIAGKYNKVFVVYTDFVSSIRQSPKATELMPLRSEDLELSSEEESNSVPAEYIFEPEPRAVLDAMLPRLVEVQMYQALLESVASEHSSRMLAMRNATDAAGEMIDDLTFTFNQARQAGITREISEIAAGKAALE